MRRLLLPLSSPLASYEDEQYKVEAAPILHTVPCVGYVVSEKARAGQVLADKLVSAQIQRGPIYRYIKEGLIDTLPNGLKANEFIGPARAGRKLGPPSRSFSSSSLTSFSNSGRHLGPILHQGRGSELRPSHPRGYLCLG